MTLHRFVAWLPAAVLVAVTGCTDGAPASPVAATAPTAAFAAASTSRTAVPMQAELSGTAWIDFNNPLGCTVTPFTIVAAGTGQWSHMGAVEMTSRHCITGTNAQGEPVFAGTAVYRAANGDQLHSSYTGTMHQAAGASTPMDGPFAITGGTGRFADASGNGTWSAEVTMNSPAGPWPTTWHKRASIVY